MYNMDEQNIDIKIRWIKTYMCVCIQSVIHLFHKHVLIPYKLVSAEPMEA